MYFHDCSSSSDLGNKFLCNRKWPPKTKRSRSNLQSWSRLFTFILIAIDQQSHLPNKLQVKSAMRSDLSRAFQFFYISFQNTVQNLVRWQGILIFLIGPQFR